MNIPDPVLDYIGSKISTNIRELEGALVRVSAFANLTHQKIDLGLAEVVLKDIITETDDKEITPALIVAETADYFDITIEALFSADRSRHLTNPRQISMYLCRELTDLSLPQIGQLFGGRDHSTVIYAVRKITSSMSTDPKIYASVSELTNFIKQKSRN